MSSESQFIEGGWATEVHRNGYRMGYRVAASLFSQKSEFQQVDVVETEGHGRMLFNDHLAMISERDEFIYHDMITHVPLFVHPNPKRVLVIGGGDGGTAREVLRHGSVEVCDMVEIDELVVEACKKFIPQTSVVFGNPKLNLMIEDGVKYVAETDKTYDVVIVDSTDPIGPAQPLFGSEFYKNIHRILADDGIVVSQGESPFFYFIMQQKLLSIIGEFFPVATIYNFNNLTYPGGLWSFTFGSKKYHPIKDFNPSQVERSPLDFQYYNADLHRACFCLPTFMQKNLEGLIKE